LFAIDHFENAELINVGSGENVSIKSLANIVASVVGYSGEIEWDISRPNGTPNRPLDYSKITELGWKPKHKLYDGLKKTYQWFVENTYYDSSK
jgi:GDP-L-fucose synthase